MTKRESNTKSGAAGEALVIGALLRMGLDVYRCIADDHGVDLAVRTAPGVFMEIQVKNKTAPFIKSKVDPGRSTLLVIVVDHATKTLYAVSSTGLEKRYDKTSKSSKCTHADGEWCGECYAYWYAKPSNGVPFESALRALL